MDKFLQEYKYMKEPKVSIISVNWNGKKHLGRLLDSIYKSAYKNLVVIVVDNGSKDGSVTFIKEYYPDVVVIKNKKNLGVAEGMNKGIKRSISEGAKYSFVCNNDTYLSKSCIEAMVKFADSKKEPVAVVPKIYLSDSDRFYTAGAPSIYNFLGTRGWGRKDKGQFNKVKKLSWALGTGLLIDNRIVKDIGYFWSELFVYHEDYEYSRRMIKQGYDIWYYPKAVMWHVSKQSTGVMSPLMFYYSTRNVMVVGRKIDGITKNIYIYLLELMKFFVAAIWSIHKMSPRVLVAYFLGWYDFLRGRFPIRYVS